MKIGDYEQMMSYLTRKSFKEGTPDTSKPKPKPLTEDFFKEKADLYIKGLIGGFPQDEMLLKLQGILDKAVEQGIVKPEEGIDYFRNRKQELLDFAKENPGETLPSLDREGFKDGTKKYDYKDPLQKNQYIMRTNEEIQNTINDPKYADYTRKDFRNEKILTRKETERKGLEFKNFGKKKKKPENIENIKRTEKIKKTQGANISVKGSGQTGKQFSHVYPLIESAKPGTKTTGTIDAKMNRALEGYNKIGQNIAEQQEFLIKNKPQNYKEEIVKLNARAKKNVMNAVKELGKDYKGQIGYFQVDPETGEFKPKAGNYKMSFAGIEGKNKIYKDMTGKERKDFEKKISAIEKAKTIPGVTTADKIKRPERALIRDQIKDFQIRTGGPTLGANLGLLKGMSETLPYFGTPLGAATLTAGFDLDPRQTMDRIGLEAEAALAPQLVEQTSKLVKNPLAQRALNLGLSPAMAMRVARIASPIGIATLLGEGAYQGGKYMLERKKLLESLTDEQKDDLLSRERSEAIQQNRRGDPEAFSGIMAANGGLISRQGFAEGGNPKDPKMNRRTFMKVMGGLASIPILGKFIKPAAKVLESAAPVVKENLAGAPDHFWNLVNKIKLLYPLSPDPCLRA
jgi:hypothetical protein